MSSRLLNKYVMCVGSLGSRIRQARNEIGVSQEGLAEVAGCAVQTMSRIERDKQMPSALILYKVAKRLERPMEWFMEGSEPKVDPLEERLLQVGVKLSDIEKHNPNIPRDVIEGMMSDGKLDWLHSIAEPPSHRANRPKSRAPRKT